MLKLPVRFLFSVLKCPRKRPEAGNSEALKGLVRSWTEKVKSKFGGRRQRKWGALRERGWGEGRVVGETGVFGYRWESLGFEMLSPSW